MPLSQQYLDMTPIKQSEFLAQLIIIGQSDDFFLEANELIKRAELAGLFLRVSPGNPSHPALSDLANPIENGPSSPQN